MPIPIPQTAPQFLTSPPPTTSISFDLIYSYVEPYLLSCAHWLNDWWDEDWGIGEVAFISLVLSMLVLGGIIWVLSRLCRSHVRFRRAKSRRRGVAVLTKQRAIMRERTRDLEAQWGVQPITMTYSPNPNTPSGSGPRPLTVSIPLSIPVTLPLPSPTLSVSSSTSYDASSSSASSSYDGSDTDYDLHSMSDSNSERSDSEPSSPVLLPLSLSRQCNDVMLLPVPTARR